MKNIGRVQFLLWLCLWLVHKFFGWIDDIEAISMMFGLLLASFLFFSKNYINLPLVLVFSAVVQLLFAPSESMQLGLPFTFAHGFESTEYFTLAFSGIYALALGVFWPRANLGVDVTNIENWVLGLSHSILMRWLYAVVVIMVLMPILVRIPVIGAILDFVWKSIYPLALIFYLRKKWRVFAVICLLLIARSIVSSFFFELGVFFLMSIIILVFLRRVKAMFALAMILIMAPMLAVIQEAKGAFRAEAFNTADLSFSTRISLFKDSFFEANSNESTELLSAELILRLNQGLYDSYVYRKGLEQKNTVVPSFFAVFVPRNFWPDKPGFDNLKLRKLGDYDSMGTSFISISQVCESFSSWGRIGGVVFLFTYGLFLGTVVHQITRIGGLIFFLSPIIFVHVVRIEADFVHVFSSLIHGGLAIWGISSFLKSNPQGS
jgi:hypothetical protein